MDKQEKSMGLARLTSYLKTKLAKTNMNNSRSHSGAVLILSSKDWVERLPVSVETSVFLLYSCFTRAANTPAGLCKLVSAMSLLGKVIGKQFGHTDMDIKSEWRLGALYVEAFYNCGFIDIYRDSGFSNHVKTAPYIVEATHKWAELHEIDYSEAALYRSTADAPSQIELNTFVKRADEETITNLNKSRSGVYLSSAQFLTDTGWKVNDAVNEAVANNIELFVNPYIKVYDEDGVEHLYDVTKAEQDFCMDNLIDSEGNQFCPHLGSKVKVNNAFKEYITLQKRTRARKTVNKKLQEEITAAENLFNTETLYWNAKLLILKKRSKLFDFNMTMRKAKDLRCETAFYQGVEADWRGRLYYAEPFLNFQGSDTARGQLMFSEGKPMTEEGLFWLFAHTAGCFNTSFSKEEIADLEWTEADYVTHLETEELDSISLDKMSLGDRVNWVQHNLALIYEIAEGKDLRRLFDMKAEKPVMGLAACIEIHNALTAMGEGEEYISYLPIAVDGTCNGSQHYSAQAKDENAADFTGLIAREIPVDYYLRVAKGMMEAMPEWFAERKMPLKHIRKGISKRAAMVRLYSAGIKKIAENMYADVYKEGFNTKYNITMLDCIELAKVAVKVIDNTNRGASDVMSYLQKLATFELGTYATFDKFGEAVDYKDLKELRESIYILTRSKATEDKERLVILEAELQSMETRLVKGNGSQYVTWTTPSGFPVKYTSYLTRKVSCFVSISGVGRLNIAGVVNTERPDMKAFMSGISPSWVHSYDAAHAMLSIDECIGKGVVSIGAIHDSFSTHACDVPMLVDALKNQFIAMYDSPQFLEDIKYNILSNITAFDESAPDNGELDLSGVIDSDYFFA